VLRHVEHAAGLPVVGLVRHALLNGTAPLQREKQK
jgi:hypothetical protein